MEHTNPLLSSSSFNQEVSFHPLHHRAICERASVTCLWATPWQPAAAFRRSWNWSPATARRSRRWVQVTLSIFPFLLGIYNCVVLYRHTLVTSHHAQLTSFLDSSFKVNPLYQMGGGGGHSFGLCVTKLTQSGTFELS